MTDVIRDQKTGAYVSYLTSGDGADAVIYQTHPMWTPGMEHLIFQSIRGSTKPQPFAMEMTTGAVARLSPKRADDWSLAHRHDRFYYRMKERLYVRRVAESFGAGEEPQLVGEFKELHKFESSSMSLDAGEDKLYVAVCIHKGREWGVGMVDLASLSWHMVCTVDFPVGHVQANPLRKGLVMFCHETGGDAPQRIWVVETTKGTPRPFYRETYDEWVTHEVWWGKDRAIFTIWPYDEEHRQLPHGVVSAGLEKEELTVHSQFPAWHTHGSPDGQWAVADDMRGNLWLIRVPSGERRLLTQGHRTEEFKNHPHPSFTPDSRAVVFTSSFPGRQCLALVRLPKWETLPGPVENGSAG
jgi:oligogalacturonide lyase